MSSNNNLLQQQQQQQAIMAAAAALFPSLFLSNNSNSSNNNSNNNNNIDLTSLLLTAAGLGSNNNNNNNLSESNLIASLAIIQQQQNLQQQWSKMLNEASSMTASASNHPTTSSSFSNKPNLKSQNSTNGSSNHNKIDRNMKKQPTSHQNNNNNNNNNNKNNNHIHNNKKNNHNNNNNNKQNDPLLIESLINQQAASLSNSSSNKQNINRSNNLNNGNNNKTNNNNNNKNNNNNNNHHNHNQNHSDSNNIYQDQPINLSKPKANPKSNNSSFSIKDIISSTNNNNNNNNNNKNVNKNISSNGNSCYDNEYLAKFQQQHDEYLKQLLMNPSIYNNIIQNNNQDIMGLLSQNPTSSNQKTQLKNGSNPLPVSGSASNNVVSSEPDETKIRYPLKYGWKRETIVKELHKNGIKGDVIYYTPDGKKMRSFQEIERFLSKFQQQPPPNSITRDHFTFSSKPIVGDFLVAKSNLNGNENVLFNRNNYDFYTENDIVAQIYKLNPNNKTLADKMNALKKLKQEQEQKFRQEHQQVKLKHQKEQENMEKKLKMKLNESVDEHLKQVEEQKLKLERLEQIKKEKIEQRERKLREKWSDFIIARELAGHHIMNYDESIPVSNKVLYDGIEEMQERYLKDFPELIQLDIDPDVVKSNELAQNEDSTLLNLDWNTDAVHVIEFVTTFGDKLIESLENETLSNGQEDSNLNSIEDNFSSILFNIESFRLGLENKNEKCRKEIKDLLMLLVKCSVNNTNFSKSTFSNSLNEEDNDDNFMISKLNQLEINDQTYSEVLRLYLKKSLIELTIRRSKFQFQVDCTKSLVDRLKLLTDSLRAKQFDVLQPNLKANIMSFLCDELLNTSNFDFTNNINNNNNTENQNINSGEEDGNESDIEIDDDRIGLVVNDLDKAIDDLNDLKHEKWQLDSKMRQVRTEKLNATVQLNQEIQKINEKYKNDQQTDELKVKLDKEIEKERDKHQKVFNQIDKSLNQIEKKRTNLRKTYEKASNKLRSGTHLGQDRFMRHYWMLANIGGILIESSKANSSDPVCYAGPGSVYYCQDTKLLVEDETETDINQLMNDLLTRVEHNEIDASAEQKYSHLIMKNDSDDPFKIKLNTFHNDFLTLSFSQLERVIKNETSYSLPQKISTKSYLNNNVWLCDNENLFKQLIQCLSKRGHREKLLAKSLTKLHDEYFMIMNEQNNDSNVNKMFDKLSTFYKDFISTKQNLIKNESVLKINCKKIEEMNNKKEKIKLLKQVYSIEDKIFNANLQQPNHNLSKKNSSSNKEEADVNDVDDPFLIAKNRLIDLEKRIERRYLKYPFAPRKKLTVELDEKTSKLSTDKIVELIRKNQQKVIQNIESVPKELERWRRLVQNSRTVSQLSLYLIELNKYIAWDKSIMKVICQICNCDDNEDKLLLCDNCDSGNHTYCFKPVLKTIPDGDWYCYVCIGKFLNGEKLCCVCGSNSNENLHKCEKCSKIFHGQCMPNAKHFKTTSKWHCVNCQNIKNGKQVASNSKLESKQKKKALGGGVQSQPVAKNGKKRKALLNDTNDSDIDSQKSAPSAKNKKRLHETSSHSEVEVELEEEQEQDNQVEEDEEEICEAAKTKKTKKSNQKSKKVLDEQPLSTAKITFTDKEMNHCRVIINEMMRSENGQPFLERVNENDYPEYYKMIKEPMDLSTIRNKLKNKQYENKEQFAYDCRLVFDNCEYFNEDESKIGQCGHKLRAYFETKWLKIFD